MKCIPLLLLFSFLFACSAPLAPKKKALKKTASVDEIIEKAFRFFDQKKFNLALKEFQKVDIDEYEFAYEVQNYIGVIYLRKMNYKKAKAYFNDALSIEPRFADAYNNLGVLYIAQGRYELALSEFQSCLSHDPRHEKALKNRKLVDDILNKKISLETIEMFSKARNKSNYSDMAKAYEAILQKQPNLKEARNNLAVSYYYLGESSKAKKLLEALLKTNPRYHEAHNNYAYVLVHFGEEELAKRHYITSIKLKPTYTISLLNLGELFFKQKNFKDAERVWRTVLKVEPLNKQAIDLLKLLN
jgi:Tfp pilus assembly protein PilF